MNEQSILRTLEACRLPEWESIPDFGLYMDQLLTYTGRALPATAHRTELTHTMVNNYVQAGLMDKPVGKKYSREAIAQLLMLNLLKQTLSQEDIRRLLRPGEDVCTEANYALFRNAQRRIEASVADSLPDSPLSGALEAVYLHLMCKMMLDDPE